ncbi:MAG: ABC transporter permease [Flavobacteriales bacterium]|nr:ABC transporter permease [Flavobacteriales bacterium]
MNKTLLIIKREYRSRIRKKSFLIMTILGPILMAGMLAAAVWIGYKEVEKQKVLVVDDNQSLFAEKLVSSEDLKFEVVDISLQQAEVLLFNSDYTSILYIPSNILTANIAKFYVKKMPGPIMQRRIEKQLEQIVEAQKLAINKIPQEIYDRINADFHISPYKIEAPGKESKVDDDKLGVGMVAAVLIFFFIFSYGTIVMRGVLEEKVGRIVEVIISSVKPIQLMYGKIIGIALVALTQFVIWSLLTAIIFVVIQLVFFQDFLDPSKLADVQMTGEIFNQNKDDILNAQQINPYLQDNILNRINYPVMFGMFIFYFVGGYMMYASLFAAIGAAVDSDTDSQQFMIPVTLPLIFSYIIAFTIIKNPEGPLAFWGSIIPFTSPIIMMLRIPIGVGDGGIPYWEVGLSMISLIIGFMICTWVAAKIYRTGILLYGKKVNYREIWKWLRYK